MLSLGSLYFLISKKRAGITGSSEIDIVINLFLLDTALF